MPARIECRFIWHVVHPKYCESPTLQSFFPSLPSFSSLPHLFPSPPPPWSGPSEVWRCAVQFQYPYTACLQEEVGFSPRRNCPLEMDNERRCFGRLFQVTGAATLKLRLPSSVAVLCTTRSQRSTERRPAWPERFAVDIQTCWKYVGPTPRILLNARNAMQTAVTRPV